jgi:DNA-binding transcriptional ArsR family regulator
MTESLQPESLQPESSKLETAISAKDDIEQRAKIFAALSDPTRLRVVELLIEQDETSCSEMAAQVGVSLALFSHHFKTLVEAGLIQTRKEGQTKYNSLNRALLLSCLASFKGLIAPVKNSSDLTCKSPIYPD